MPDKPGLIPFRRLRSSGLSLFWESQNFCFRVRRVPDYRHPDLDGTGGQITSGICLLRLCHCMVVLGNDYFLSWTAPVKGCDSEFHKVVREAAHAIDDRRLTPSCVRMINPLMMAVHTSCMLPANPIPPDWWPIGDGPKRSGCNAAITVRQGACFASQALHCVGVCVMCV